MKTVRVEKWKFGLGNRLVNKDTGEITTIVGADKNKQQYIVGEFKVRIDREELENSYEVSTINDLFNTL